MDIAAGEAPGTALTDYFRICGEDAFAATLLFAEMPAFYVLQGKKWRARQRGDPVPDHPHVRKKTVLGRLYTVSPREGELYFLRLLLTHVRN